MFLLRMSWLHLIHYQVLHQKHPSKVRIHTFLKRTDTPWEITVLFNRHNTRSSKCAKIGLSKTIFYDKNHLKFNLHLLGENASPILHQKIVILIIYSISANNVHNYILIFESYITDFLLYQFDIYCGM